MLKTKIKYTYDDYAAMDDDKRYELIEGELYMVPAPGFQHQTISRNLGVVLWEFVKENNLGTVLYAPFDVVLSETDVVQPDIIFLSKERMDLMTEKNLRGAPDLAIEILSSTTKERDKLVKKRLYGDYGVKEFWIVDPDKETVEIMVWKETGFGTFGIYCIDDELTSPLLKGFRLDLKEVFLP
ncbi:MAG: Uma2 family endonuclease [Candidatus Brocadia sp.]|nr:Uma2 family endonuclease [Candidatus Brocadia sp.]NUO08528.1 Uma2 family endonuclease [Candidatus Brocadia sp.]